MYIDGDGMGSLRANRQFEKTLFVIEPLLQAKCGPKLFTYTSVHVSDVPASGIYFSVYETLVSMSCDKFNKA